MVYRETTRWYLERLHQEDHKIVNIEPLTDISRSQRSIIYLDKTLFQHISKAHCVITCHNGVATLTDETSSTGTFVNDRKFSREHPGSMILSEGDRIGIGTSCNHIREFYEQNRHVLLFKVCKYRNRIVRDGDVDLILSSDEEPEDIKPQHLQLVPQLATVDRRSGNQYRIVEQIDLSSDDEDVKNLDSVERVTRLDSGMLVGTERMAKRIEAKQNTEVQLTEGQRTDVAQGQTKNDEKRTLQGPPKDDGTPIAGNTEPLCNSKVGNISKDTNEEKEMKNDAKDSPDSPDSLHSPDSPELPDSPHEDNGKLVEPEIIHELFDDDTRSDSCSSKHGDETLKDNTPCSDGDRKSLDPDNENSSNMQEIKQDDRVIKIECDEELIIEIDHDEPDRSGGLFRDSYINLLSPDSTNIPIISIDDSDDDADDENDFSEKKLTQSFYRQIKIEAQEIVMQEDELDSANHENFSNTENAFTVTSGNLSTTEVHSNDEDEKDLEDTKKWFALISKRNSLPSSNGPINIDDYQSRDQALEDDFFESILVAESKDDTNEETGTARSPSVEPSRDQLLGDDFFEGIFVAEPKSDTNEETGPARRPSVEPSRDQALGDDFFEGILESEPKDDTNVEPKTVPCPSVLLSVEIVEKSIEPDIANEKPDENDAQSIKNDAQSSPEPKRRKLSDTSATDTCSGTAKVVGLIPTSPVSVRVATIEKNSSSASNVWVSRKISIVEPHHIQKRGSNSASASKKSSKHIKHSPNRNPEKKDDVSKQQKLKDISTKKSQTVDPTNKSSFKTHTKPRVKFTPNNRGAFLVEETPSPTKPTNQHESASINSHDLNCTPSTSQSNAPIVDDDFDITIPINTAPKLTFESVSKVSNVTRNRPRLKITKRRPSIPHRPPLHEVDIFQFEAQKVQLAPKTPTVKVVPELAIPLGASLVSRNTSQLKSILKPSEESSLDICKKPLKNPKKQVNWKESLSETRTFEIDDGNFMFVQTKYYKDNKDYFRDMSQASCQNDIIEDITSWSADWFDNPSEATISREKLLPMVEEYKDFEDYKRIVLPILKAELFHDILSQYVEVKKTAQKPIQMKVNQIRSQGRIFVLNCSVESSNHQSINNKDYVLIIFKDKSTAEEMRVPAVVVTRRQQVQYAGENGLKFYHCTVETAKTSISQRIRDGGGENYHILSLTQINIHMRQFYVLFNLQTSPLLDNVISPKSNFYRAKSEFDRGIYKGKERLNVQQGDTLLSVFEHCVDLSRPHIMLIQGPPGTGKTRLICNLILQLHRGMPNDKRMKILICAQSNSAVDVIVLKMMKLYSLLNRSEQSSMLRTGTPNKINHCCKPVFLDDLARKHVNEQIKCRKLREEDPIYESYYLEKDGLERKIRNLEGQARNAGSKKAALNKELKRLQEQLNEVKALLPVNIDDMDLHDKDRWSCEQNAKKLYVSKADIICTTLASAGGLMEYSQSLKFDVCIIDEATLCTEIASFTPLQYDVKKLILVGDGRQLPPFVYGKECAEAGLKKSLFSRIEKSFFGTGLEGVKMLTTQYRMHPEILKWPNEFYYDNKILSDLESTKCDGFPFKPYSIFSLEYQRNDSHSEKQINNNDEIQFVIQLLVEIMKYCERHTSIAIIIPLVRHRREIEKYLFNQRITQVSVLSFDSAQGLEYDVVIISLARSVVSQLQSSPQRLNVVLTRARKCLIMCAKFSELRNTDVWSALLKDAEVRRVLYEIEDDDEYDDTHTSVEKVMRYLRKTPPSNDT